MIGKLASQVRASKLTDYQLTNKLLEQGEIDKLQLRFDALNYGINKHDNKDGRTGSGRGGRGDSGTQGLPPPKTAEQEMDEITKRLSSFRENTPDVSPDNTRE